MPEQGGVTRAKHWTNGHPFIAVAISGVLGLLIGGAGASQETASKPASALVASNSDQSDDCRLSRTRDHLRGGFLRN